MSIVPGGAFTLTDHDGHRVTEADFRNRPALLFFGFTHCRVVCPRVLSRWTEALALLGDAAAEVQPLYISVDPKRDTPDVMRQFLTERFPRFLGLTGSKEEIEAVKKAYHVFAARQPLPDGGDGYDMPHSSLTFLLDRQGSYRAHFHDSGTAEQAAERLRALL